AADGEAEAGAARRTGVAVVSLLELVENALLVLGADARAIVDDAEADALVALGGGAEALSAQGDARRLIIVAGELHGVAEQVEEDLLQLLEVGLDDRGIGLDLGEHGGAAALGLGVDE